MQKPKRVDLILIAKPPEPGEAKTRLSLNIGDKAAISVYTRLLNGGLRAVAASLADRKTVYTYGDDRYLIKLRESGFHVAKDVEGYRLHEKVYGAFRDSLSRCTHSLMVVADDPSITNSFLNLVISKVLSDKVVIGPTVDGGLYLIGISKLHLPIVEGLPFGKPNLYETLIKRAISKTFAVEILPFHVDVDSEEAIKHHKIIY